jgi:serine/threonine-protein kinase HipA
MTSEFDEAYVWVWLPDASAPVVAGRLHRTGEVLAFNYGRSYLDRDDAVPLYELELPLGPGRIIPPGGLEVAGCLRDAGPDAWGKRVVRHRLTSAASDPDLLTYLLASDSDRFGAIDFQRAPDEYVARTGSASLEDLLTVAEKVNAGEPIPESLAEAAMRGTSMGGARPKAVVLDGDRHLIAKFPLFTDPYNVVGAEAVAMELARRVGLDVAATTVVEVLGRQVLLVERFDREDGRRRRAVSALTILGLSEYPAGRYATYTGLADAIRMYFTEPRSSLRELFARIAFNMCVSNTDDHARNHAAFVDDAPGTVVLRLTPAYDIEPPPRTGDTAAQSMAYGPEGERETRLASLLEASAYYHLDADEARALIDDMVHTIAEQFDDAAEVVRLPRADREAMRGRQILHPSLAYGYEGQAARTIDHAVR